MGLLKKYVIYHRHHKHFEFSLNIVDDFSIMNVMEKVSFILFNVQMIIQGIFSEIS